MSILNQTKYLMLTKLVWTIIKKHFYIPQLTKKISSNFDAVLRILTKGAFCSLVFMIANKISPSKYSILMLHSSI